ncbi:MAG: hypothetical protein ACFCD0_20085 [Gemmataceae bacterium]
MTSNTLGQFVHIVGNTQDVVTRLAIARIVALRDTQADTLDTLPLGLILQTFRSRWRVVRATLGSTVRTGTFFGELFLVSLTAKVLRKGFPKNLSFV